MIKSDLVIVPLVPSLTILDQWLPAIEEMQRTPRVCRFVFIVDATSKVPRVFSDSDFFKHSEKLSSGALVLLNSGKVRRARNLKWAERVATWDRQWNRAKSVLFRFCGGGRSAATENFAHLQSVFTPSELSAEPPVVLSDPKVLLKHDRLVGLLDFWGANLWILKSHGSLFSNYSDSPETQDLSQKSKKIHFLVDSERDATVVGRTYGLDNQRIHIVAPPQISPSWKRYIRSIYSKWAPRPFIVLFSSPSTPSRLTYPQKARALRCIAASCRRFSFDLRIRLHPKESRIKVVILAGVISMMYRTTKIIVDRHPALVLADKAERVVLFSSSLDAIVSDSNTPAILFREPSARQHWRFGFTNQRGIQLSPGEAGGICATALNCSDFTSWAQNAFIRQGLSASGQTKSLATRKSDSPSQCQRVSDVVYSLMENSRTTFGK